MQGQSDNNPTYFQMSHIWHILPKIEIKRYKPKPIHQVNDSIIYECNLMDVFPNYGSIINVCSLMIVPCFFPIIGRVSLFFFFFNPKKIRKNKKKSFENNLVPIYKATKATISLDFSITSSIIRESPNNIGYACLLLVGREVQTILIILIYSCRRGSIVIMVFRVIVNNEEF